MWPISGSAITSGLSAAIQSPRPWLFQLLEHHVTVEADRTLTLEREMKIVMLTVVTVFLAVVVLVARYLLTYLWSAAETHSGCVDPLVILKLA